jgi:hypothetical protein
VCTPRYVDSATGDAGKDFLRALFFDCGGRIDDEACLTRNASARAQGAVAAVHPQGRELTAEVERLARENPEFRRAITEFHAVERRYDDARRAEGPAMRVSAAVVDTRKTLPARPGRDEDIVPPETDELPIPEGLFNVLEVNGAGQGVRREGWIELRYSVRADGTTADVRVIDVVPPGLDAAAAVAVAESWTFEPATAKGAPIDWHNNVAVIAFDRDGTETDASPAFAAAYEEVVELVSSGRYARAKARNERMQSELAVDLYEIGLAQMQLAAIEHALGDPHAALDAIRRATAPAVPQLSAAELETALMHRFLLEVHLGRGADALDTYERRVAMSRLPEDDPMTRQAAALEQALTAPRAGLVVQGRLDGDGREEHVLTWRTFAVAGIDARDAAIEAECHRNKANLPFDADVELTLPATWGECVLLLEGPPNAAFTLYEFSDSNG